MNTNLTFEDINTICSILDHWRDEFVEEEETELYDLIDEYIDKLRDTEEYRRELVISMRNAVIGKLEENDE